MKFPDIDSFKMNDTYLEEIFPSVWLMDDHRWAYYIWEKVFLKNENEGSFALVHLACRWDGVNDFYGDPTAVRNLVEINDIDRIYSLVQRNRYVRKDSFIAPAIIRGLVDEVHFYCRQTGTGPGLYPPFLKEHKARQFIYGQIEPLLSHQISKPIIFDIDLDLFNKSDMWDEGGPWTDQEIVEFLSMCSNLIRSSSVVTAAMSFGCSGTKQDTRHSTRLFTSFMRDLITGSLKGS
ncbi:MAG: hypothetical protein A4E65_03306 [Syntrophorhabdus sp. PtaU1.Bin153]|nr:MAG: hypothetical protein A4E65_03306 [Syntrophorhabdus sp. PtaU1.Bin153]